MICVNFFGGPGSGKSTTAAHTFALLKWAGVNCELATEYAKDKVWEDSLAVLHDQPYMLGKQHHKLFVLQDKVDVVLTDSPLLLSTVYGAEWGENFRNLAFELYHRHTNINFFMTRLKEYNPKGRVQDEAGARELDDLIKNMLINNEIPFEEVPGDTAAADYVYTKTWGHLRQMSEDNVY